MPSAERHDATEHLHHHQEAGSVKANGKLKTFLCHGSSTTSSVQVLRGLTVLANSGVETAGLVKISHPSDCTYERRPTCEGEPWPGEGVLSMVKNLIINLFRSLMRFIGKGMKV